jgi:hypothetical protein
LKGTGTLAEKFFKKSFDINPSYAQAHYWYGLDYLTWALVILKKRKSMEKSP